MRQIDVTLTPLVGIDPVQREYFVACALADNGVPINPLTHDLTHGALMVEMDFQTGQRHYTWIGEDRRQ